MMTAGVPLILCLLSWRAYRAGSANVPWPVAPDAGARCKV